MAFLTAVPRPSFGDKGFVAPTEAAILAGVQADINTALGGGVNPGLSTPQGQLASSETAIIGDKNNEFLYFTNQVDPALNSGRMQDAIGRIYYMRRIAGRSTVVSATCSGLDGVIIGVGSIAKAQDGNLYICQELGTITDGSVVLPFACAVNGPIPCPADDTDWTIYQTIFGWDSVTTSEDGVLGRLVESRSEFEARRAASVAANARGMLDAVEGAVLAVDGVLDARSRSNDLGYPATVDGVTLKANSIYVSVVGGDSQEIAEAIWSKKMPGCGYNGSTTMTVEDPNPAYVAPIPSYAVSFQRPAILDFAMLVVLRNSANIPADALAQIQDAIVDAFAGADGGTRAQIGSTVYASRYYATVALLGSWATIIDIQLGVSDAAAAFTASIAGTVMTVSAVASGALDANQLLQGTAGNIEPGTTITEQLTGTPEGTGTYRVSPTQTLLSDSLTATALVNDVTLTLAQVPAIAPASIYLSLRQS